MSNKRKSLDTRQMAWDFEAKIDEYIAFTGELLAPPVTSACPENFDELCIEIAATVKQIVRSSNLSREQWVDKINRFFDWTGKKGLSIHMFNNYLSKPTEYHIPFYLIVAVQKLSRSLEIAAWLAEMEGGKAISSEEIQALNLGKVQSLMAELNNVKKTLQQRPGGRR